MGLATAAADGRDRARAGETGPGPAGDRRGGGRRSLRFNGQSTTAIVAGRVSTPVGEIASFEVGLALVPNENANAISRDSAVFVLPELGLVLGPHGGSFHPYVGAGIGVIVDVTHLSDGGVGPFAALGGAAGSVLAAGACGSMPARRAWACTGPRGRSPSR